MEPWEQCISFGDFLLFFCSLLQLTLSLNELNFSFNKMNQLEPFIGKLEKLVFLDLG